MLLTAHYTERQATRSAVKPVDRIKQQISSAALRHNHRPGDAPILSRMQSSQVCRVTSGDAALSDTLERWRRESPHSAGVVSLDRLAGDEERAASRYVATLCRLSAARGVCGIAYVLSDRIDRRSRLLELQVRRGASPTRFLADVVDSLPTGDPGEPMVSVVEIVSGSEDLEDVVSQLGYVPTAYYSGIAGADADRSGAFQWTRVRGYSPSECGIPDSLRDWPEAMEIAELAMDQIRRQLRQTTKAAV
jgi:hypothetical protein